tara:strand:+ start:30541 stop:30672 length:132 start_codon:yes stop_codon:yes gene_type:complete
MKKFGLLVKASFLLLTAPAEISKGQRRRKISKAKRIFSSVNLF